MAVKKGGDEGALKFMFGIYGLKKIYMFICYLCMLLDQICQPWFHLPYLNPPAGAIWLYIQNNTTPLFSLFSLCTWVQCVATRHVACGSFLHFLSLFLPQYTRFLSVAVIIIV